MSDSEGHVPLKEDKEKNGLDKIQNGLEPSPKRSRVNELCSPILTSSHPLPPSPSLGTRIKYGMLCPPHGVVGDILTYSLALFTIWGAAYSMMGQIALPGEKDIAIKIQGGTVFALLALLVFGWIGGWLVQRIKIPPLLGMLVVGVLLNNVPGISVARGLDPAWSAATRSIALAIILLRAGLGLDPAALKQLSAMVFRLAFTPCLVETVVVAIVSHFLLGIPWLWGFMLGFVLAAVSPAVVVPCLLSLQESGYGVAKGIPTLVIAAASVDDVLAISCFTIILGITFNTDASLAFVILQGPLEAVVGVVWGLVWGGLTVYLPPKPDRGLRLLLLGGGSLLALFGSDVVGLKGAGALAVLVMAFTAGVGWRSQGWGDDNPVTDSLAGLWLIFQPLLFSLIGTEIRLDALSPVTVGWGILVLACGLSFRIVVSYLAVLGGQLTHRERLFISMAWLPKATVQAAIGPIALDKAKQALDELYSCNACKDVAVETTTMVTKMVNGTCFSDGTDDKLEGLCNMVEYGGTVLTLAVLAILITAPIGAIAIMGGGPKLLQKGYEKSDTENA